MIRYRRMAELDFLARDPRPWAGIALLGSALVLCSLMALAWWQRADEVTRLAGLLARAREQATASAKPKGPSPQQVAIVTAHNARLQRMQSEILRPWSGLLDAIESAHGPKVQLLAIEPDAKSGKVQISGTTQSFADATAYVRRLQNSALTQVMLASHQRPVDPPGAALQFVVTAQWLLPNLPARGDEIPGAQALASAAIEPAGSAP